MIVKEIADFIDAQITTTLSDYRKLDYVYEPLNNERLFKKAYGITVGASNTIPGTNRAATLEGSFNVLFMNSYESKKNAGDESARTQVFNLHSDIETLYKILYRRPFATVSGHALQVSGLDITEPLIENNSVSVTLTLTIQYRVQTN